MTTPFTSWDQVPLICRLVDIARVMNRSTRTLEKWLAHEPWRLPAPEPRLGKTEPLTWRKSAVQRFVEQGGAAARRPGQPRKFFPKAASRDARKAG